MNASTPELWDRLNALRMVYEEREGYTLEVAATEVGVVLRGNAAGLLALASQLAQLALASDPGAPLRLDADSGLSGGSLNLHVERVETSR